MTIEIAFQVSITAEVSACSEDGQFGWLQLGVQHCPECPHTSEFMLPITGTNRPRPNPEKHSHTIMLPPPNLTVGTIVTKETFAGHLQTQMRPSDCQTVKQDSSLQRTVFHRSTEGELYTIAIDALHSVE
ncbi:hypothetical protein TNCV_2274871 [Trichonephila clavipes]|nr:hypothetical protein TNCV_2274871 [Trichonephila clavipes]